MTIPIPIPGIKDGIEGLNYLSEWLHGNKRQKLLNAWENRQTARINRALLDYYRNDNHNLFSYPKQDGTRIKVPLYVKPSWRGLSDSNINMKFNENSTKFNPAKSQKSFWEFYREFKKREINEDDWPLYDSPIFRLLDIDDKDDEISLSFELGKFSDSVMCQYILEHELVTSLVKDSIDVWADLKLRNSVAANPQMFNSFFRNNVCRIGICNLILLRSDKNSYIPMVQPRSGLSMVGEGLYDAVSSCIFEVATEPKADFNLQHTVLREIFEELFGNPDVATKSRELDPYFFYKKDGISDLIEMLNNGAAIFQITGFCIDLIRIVPEITTLLIVKDESYFQKHYSPSDSSIAQFCLNPEFERTSLLNIPESIDNVDNYLISGDFFNQIRDHNKNFMDFTKWTLPGGFSFYQGLKKAISNNLLLS